MSRSVKARMRKKSPWIKRTHGARDDQRAASGKTYHYRPVAANANDEAEPVSGGDVVFGPPLIESESSVDVAASRRCSRLRLTRRTWIRGCGSRWAEARGMGRHG